MLAIGNESVSALEQNAMIAATALARNQLLLETFELLEQMASVRNLRATARVALDGLVAATDLALVFTTEVAMSGPSMDRVNVGMDLGDAWTSAMVIAMTRCAVLIFVAREMEVPARTVRAPSLIDRGSPAITVPKVRGSHREMGIAALWKGRTLLLDAEIFVTARHFPRAGRMAIFEMKAAARISAILRLKRADRARNSAGTLMSAGIVRRIVTSVPMIAVTIDATTAGKVRHLFRSNETTSLSQFDHRDADQPGIGVCPGCSEA